MNEQQYRTLCQICDELLLDDCGNSARQAIAWLHVIRAHPVFLQRYERLFTLSSIKSRADWIGLKEGLLQTLRFARQMARSCLYVLTGQTSTIDKLGTADTVFVSHLLDPIQKDAGNDFYFGTLPAKLAAHGRKVAVVMIDHTALSVSRVRWSVSDSGVLRVVLSNTLEPNKEFRFLISLWRQSKCLVNSKSDSGLRAKIRTAAAAEALSSASFQSLRIATQVGELIKQLNASTLITTFEGHAWERATNIEARRQLSGIRCIGYQHAALFPLQHALRRRLCNVSDPDVILVSGSSALYQMAAYSDVRILGSNRAGSLTRFPSYENRLQRFLKPFCLVIPEGLIDESGILFEYALRCAERLPEVTFILRMHPIISLDILVKHYPLLSNVPKNVDFSSGSLEGDAERASWAMYRGSTAIVSAVLAGAAPIYLRIENEMSIDPLHQLDSERAVVLTVNDFIEIVHDNISKYPTEEQANAVVQHCKEIFSPLSPDVLVSYLENIDKNPYESFN